jgi:hypothetical protein
MKKYLLIALFSTAMFVGFVIHQNLVIAQSEDGILAAEVAEAKAAGKGEVYIAVNIGSTGVDNLDAAISRYSVIEATPIEKKVYKYDKDGLISWYKFKVNNKLSEKAVVVCSTCTPFPDLPADMLPLAADEIVISRSEGSFLIDNVVIIQDEVGFPAFTLNQRYLLFAGIDWSKKVGEIAVGPIGAYMVNDSGKTIPVYDSDASDDNPIYRGLASTYNNSIYEFRKRFSTGGSNPEPNINCSYRT